MFCRLAHPDGSLADITMMSSSPGAMSKEEEAGAKVQLDPEVEKESLEPDSKAGSRDQSMGTEPPSDQSSGTSGIRGERDPQDTLNHIYKLLTAFSWHSVIGTEHALGYRLKVIGSISRLDICLCKYLCIFVQVYNYLCLKVHS